ncbi:acetyl-CoA C-acyltransferase [Paracidobacterium acidisoli]|uniref:acetyl-CoA C-acyltransferase n=1 Tax=Paracidobacterium acidisoli TaxID=2303751 RepID=A0A372INZ4_9BACT|nr:acetyl-CoA C-acyltransferase [Paracidobacterium acidisoli]MBT9330985.1 acetyl-CoA C-acyltransferase [Paracidobacterium acidisoli]
MAEVFIASSMRTAVGKAPRGALAGVRPDDLAAVVMGEALKRVPALDGKEIDDVILGCAMPEAEQGMNVARIASLRAGLPVEVPAMTINRFCSSGLQAIAIAAQQIIAGQSEAAIAGGTESMSMVPMGGNKVSANPWLMEHYADTYLSMGLTAENLARRYGITREQADEFSLASHRKALAAIEEGRFADEIVPIMVTNMAPGASPAKPVVTETVFETDEGPRADTSAEALAKLKAAFHAQGIVTAGNSSQTSDGAAASVVISGERAKALGIEPLGRFVSFATAGCPPEVMGIGPVLAIPKALKLAGLTLEEIDLIELNEAFAVQALAVIQQAGLNPKKVNVNGGAIALGHPLGCTGAKLTATLLHELKRQKLRYGLVTMCVGGGMGAAGVFERVG